ncbi:hypothetical protein BOH72_01735 [Mycobacterium sp. WY10]|nr:hypothetical protein BOH72_01735 [Mycobacterium sp. WY10]
MSSDDDLDLIDIPQAAEITKLSVSTIRWWVHKETECGVYFGHFGRRRLARRSDIEAWVRSKLPTPAEVASR